MDNVLAESRALEWKLEADGVLFKLTIDIAGGPGGPNLANRVDFVRQASNRALDRLVDELKNAPVPIPVDAHNVEVTNDDAT